MHLAQVLSMPIRFFDSWSHRYDSSILLGHVAVTGTFTHRSKPWSTPHYFWHLVLLSPVGLRLA